MAPGSPQGGKGAGDVFGWECCATDAAVVLDEIDQRSEWAAAKFGLPGAGHGEPRAFDRERNGDEVADGVGHGGVGHHRPIGAPIFAVVEDATNDEQISEIGDVGELHEVIARGRSELLKPHGWVHAGEPEIGGDEFGVLPSRRDEMNQVGEFFEAEKEKEMRIPVAPEVPEFLRER